MANKAKQKYYVVWKGVKPGIYNNWTDCRLQTQGYEGAIYKSFDSYGEAVEAMHDTPWQHIGQSGKTLKKNNCKPYITESLAVDAACSGNPGDMEYRGVYVETGQELFRLGPLKQGTNNIGEFLALVHGLAYFKKIGCQMPIYTDSHNAMLWVQQKQCKTKLVQTTVNTPIFNLIERAEKWLQENEYTTRIIKWDTQTWGEIPADFGRKKN